MTDPLFAATPPRASGVLPEMHGHRVFWETFGDPARPAILLLHGGPGGGTAPRMPRLFDPARWHIVTLDQRGAGRSRPSAASDVAALTANTTPHLLADLERLRQMLGIARWTLYGASWGTALAQAYAQAHPARTEGLILASITTVSRAEIDMLYGHAGQFLPEAFAAFRAGAPDGQPGVDMARAYGDLLTCGDPDIEARAALDWCAWEEAVLQADPRAEPAGHFTDPAFRLGFARVVTHYFRHLAWFDPPLLARTERMAGRPVSLINSRLDLSCPPAAAFALHQRLPGSALTIVPGALHGTLYGPLAEAIVRAGTAHADALA